MTDLEQFLKEQGYSLEHNDKGILLEKVRKLNITSLIVGAVGVGVLMLIGIVIPPAAFLMYLISFVIVLVVFRFNYRGVRPITVFDWTHTTMVRRSVYAFVNSKSVKIRGFEGVGIRVKDWSSTSSEGVDEYQKTIYLNTADGEIDVVDFYTEGEAIESPITEIANIIENYLKVKA